MAKLRWRAAASNMCLPTVGEGELSDVLTGRCVPNLGWRVTAVDVASDEVEESPSDKEKKTKKRGRPSKKKVDSKEEQPQTV